MSKEVLLHCTELPSILGIPDINQMGPRFPATPFLYSKKLANNNDLQTRSVETNYINELLRFFKGAVRPESTNFLLNIHPQPDAYALAAACLAIYHNMDGLMDEYSGEALLIEQQLIREIGTWAGYANALGTGTAGGKITTLYAIRAALSRISSDYLKTGIPNKTIVITSAGAHYSLRHTISILGIGTSNCWEIPMDENGAMNCTVLADTLRKAWNHRYKVAAIICCGGSTIDFHCDNLKDVYETVIFTIGDYPEESVPYLHVDAVIGWQYLSISSLTSKENESLSMSLSTRERIEKANQRLKGIKFFDSFGVDFHKNGLCPISSSFFISKDNHFMADLSLDDDYVSFSESHLGQHRAYRYTLENSRTLHGVIAAWSVLTRLGRIGIANYLIDLHSSREAFEATINTLPEVELTRQASLGWEVLFHIRSCNESDSNILSPKMTSEFFHYCSDLCYKGYNIPLFGIVPTKDNYSLLIYPMRKYSIDETFKILRTIISLWRNFCSLRPEDRGGQHFKDASIPIR